MPPFNAGHWTPELISLAGGIDVLGNPGKPSNGLLWADIVSAQPDVIVVACCGFSAERSHVDLYELGQRMELKSVWSHLGDTRVIILDGKFFSCPSPGLIDGLEILAHVLHPNYHAKLHNVCYSWFKLSDFMA